MPLKKLPPEMNYAALREAQPPSHRASVPATSGAAYDEASAIEEHAGPVPRAAPAETKASSFISAKVAAPPSASDGNNPGQTDPNRDDRRNARSAPASKRAAGNGSRQHTRGANASAERVDRVHVRGYVQIPAEGTFAVFDELATIYGERKAASLALTAGLREYGEAAAEGRSLAVPSGYTSLTSIEVGRTLPATTLEAARNALDPRGLLGSYQLGGAIFQAALGQYLAKG